MDFGPVGLDGLMVGSDSGFSSSLPCSDPEMKQKWYGSAGFLHKQDRSVTAEDDDNLRISKLHKTSSSDDINNNDLSSSSSKGMLFPPLRQQQHSSSLRSNAGFFVSDTNNNHPQEPHQMLSFSSPKSEIPNFFHPSSTSRNTGCNYGNLSSGNMQGNGNFSAGIRSPFTPSQWMELEHQAWIYKYITANVPVPSSLLIPIRKALESAGFSPFSAGFLRPTSVGWGSFNVGFSNNSDPEPGRCRRTDGKKWRCSRDAVADQKYCERHMNRGRHRSRKPVEGQAGHSVAGTSNIANATHSKLVSSSPLAAVVVPSNCNQPFKTLQRGGSQLTSAATAGQLNRMFMMNKDNGGNGLQDTTSGHSVLSPVIDMKAKPLPFAIQKPQNPFEEASRAEFGLISSSYLNPAQKSSSMMTYRNFNASHDITTTQEAAENQNSLRQFFNNWPKNQSDSSSVSWSNSNPELQSDRTQLSISIPSDFRSSTSSPTHDKVTLSPLKLSQELDPIQMGLGVGNVVDGPNIGRQANWIPISWENSMGGPLGEVLHSTSNNASESKSSSILNLMTEGWDNSPSLGSSPTGVLQKTAFGSFSNSSTGSSPRTESKNHEGGSQCSERVGSTFVTS